MVESRCCLGLLNEPPLSFRIGDFLGRENLDGDEPVQVRVPSLVHHAHAAAPQGFNDLVVLEGASDHGTPRIFGSESNCIAERARWIERRGRTLLMPDTGADIRSAWNTQSGP